MSYEAKPTSAELCPHTGSDKKHFENVHAVGMLHAKTNVALTNVFLRSRDTPGNGVFMNLTQ